MTTFWRLPNFRLSLAVLLTLIGINLGILPWSGIRIDGHNLTTVAYAVVPCFFMAAFAAFVMHRLADDDHVIARGLSRAAASLFDLTTAGPVMIVFGVAIVVASYLVITLGMPFQDDAYAAMDRALGLDWVEALKWANSDPRLTHVLFYAYASAMAQLGIMVVVLSVVGDSRGLWEYLVIIMLSALLTLLTSGAFPALAPFHHFQPDPSLHQAMDAIKPDVARSFVPDLLALRDGTFGVLDLRHADGLICFPSFHCIMGLSFVYATRHMRYLFWPMAVLNGIMIVATVPIGGHYFVDIIAGFAYFAATVAVVDHINGEIPFWRRWRLGAADAAANAKSPERPQPDIGGLPEVAA